MNVNEEKENLSENKEGFQSKDINEKTIENQTSNENSKPKTMKKKKEPATKVFCKNNMVSTIVILSLSILIGAGGGFLFFRWKNPSSAALSGSGSEGYIPTEAEISKSLNNDSLIDDYKDKEYQVINYSLYQHSLAKYALTIGKAKVVSSGVTQSIQSSTYSTPDVIYNQNVSSSSLVKTANRFYDYLDNKVDCYLESLPSDWSKGNSPITYTYDEYMQKYGKLLQGSYYCTATTNSSEVTEATPIADRYLTSDKSVYEANNDKTKHHVNGVVIYMIGPKSIKDANISKSDDSYLVSLDLYTDNDRKNATDSSKITTGNSYYSVQMRSTGSLASRPVFSKTHLEFTLDKNLNLVSSYFYDEYTAVVGPINSPATSDMYQYYFQSEDDTFNDVKVSVPSPTDDDIFKGYDLFPKEG